MLVIISQLEEMPESNREKPEEARIRRNIGEVRFPWEFSHGMLKYLMGTSE